MTRINNRKDVYNKEKEKKDITDQKNVASTFMNIMSKKRGEQSDGKEAWKQLDDDNNCEAVAKQTNKQQH